MRTTLGIFILLIALLLQQNTHAQNESDLAREDVFKNSVSINGVRLEPIALYNNLHLRYQRVLFYRPKDWKFSIIAQAKAGITFGWGDFVLYGAVDGIVLTGIKKHHLELGLGISYMKPDLFYDLNVIPSGQIGYRFQKKGHPFLFRAGISLPEVIYIGAGLSF